MLLLDAHDDKNCECIITISIAMLLIDKSGLNLILFISLDDGDVWEYGTSVMMMKSKFS